MSLLVRTVIVAALFFLPGGLSAGKEVAGTEVTGGRSQDDKIAETARIYLEANGGYIAGDLLTESQIDELQAYLRLSQGNSPATHRDLLKRTLKDRAPLARFFYQKHGSQVLRSAAQELGGYAKLEALSLDSGGRAVLKRAISAGSAPAIVEAIAQDPQYSQTPPSEADQGEIVPRFSKIFTLQDFLEASRAH